MIFDSTQNSVARLEKNILQQDQKMYWKEVFLNMYSKALTKQEGMLQKYYNLNQLPAAKN